MIYNSSENRECYFPPLISNGEIAFAPDCEGMLGYSAGDYLEKGMTAFDGIVVRSQRRTALCSKLQARLFPFGKFTFNEGTPLENWSQSLEPEKGYFESECSYESGTYIHSKGFIHPELNIYALQKKFENICGEKQFSFKITLSGYDEFISEYMSILYVDKKDDVCRIGFKMYGMKVFIGEINVFTDKDFDVIPSDDGALITFCAKSGETVNFYYYVEDNLNGTDFDEVLKNYKSKIDRCGFCGLLNECENHFEEFFSTGYVETSDQKLNSIYKTALYGIKCNATNYSIAVGFNNGSWDGRFFAFDEYTSYLGLLGANRLELAKRVPTYRLNNCLDTAVKRASDCHRNFATEDMARFHWETGEYDHMELSPDGNWLDHVFHMPLIGIGAFNFYEYTGDIEFLKECYRMIRACAKFITKHMVYKDGNKLYIGKCTDLERLGSSVENPFMTSCGAIKLLRCCAKAAEVLNTDAEYAKECEQVADKLYENLPVENEMYIPHPGCKQKSISVFAGKFPFDVLCADDDKMHKAWDDFEQNGAAYGNMYPWGRGISPWYACWKALGYARCFMTDKAYDSLKQAYNSVGVFDEMFEINEPEVRWRPWFATASGIFTVAVNEMLLQSDGKTIRILPSFPHDTDVSFKLAAKGGITVEAKVENGVLKKVVILKSGTDVTNQFKIEF